MYDLLSYRLKTAVLCPAMADFALAGEKIIYNTEELISIEDHFIYTKFPSKPYAAYKDLLSVIIMVCQAVIKAKDWLIEHPYISIDVKNTYLVGSEVKLTFSGGDIKALKHLPFFERIALLCEEIGGICEASHGNILADKIRQSASSKNLTEEDILKLMSLYSIELK